MSALDPKGNDWSNNVFNTTMNAALEEKPVFLKLNLGCGRDIKSGWTNVDSRKFDGVDIVADLSQPWPWADESVEEIHLSHVLEHFTADQRVHIANEIYRVLITGGKATIITPHWAHNRAYGDPTHQWPPVSEMWYCYLQRDWRKSQAPHTDIEWNPQGFSCEFDWMNSHTFDTGPTGKFVGRNSDYSAFALANYRDTVMDLQATITKRSK